MGNKCIPEFSKMKSFAFHAVAQLRSLGLPGADPFHVLHTAEIDIYFDEMVRAVGLRMGCFLFTILCGTVQPSFCSENSDPIRVLFTV